MRVADGVTFVEDDDGWGAVFLWGTVAWCWAAGDRAARRLAAVQLVETKAARQRQVAAAFGVNEDSVILWRGEYAANGATALAGRRPGPKGPSKLTEAKRLEIGALRAQGLTLTAVSQRVGVSIDTVRRALARTTRPPLAARTGESAPLRVRRPPDDSVELHPAPAGLIPGASVVPDGRTMPLAGALVVLPALTATGLLETVVRVFDSGQAGLSCLRPLVLAMVYGCLLEGSSAAEPSHVDPADIGRLVGLDPEPGIETMRQQMRDLAVLGRAASLIDTLARRRLDARLGAEGILSSAGGVRAYRRAAELSATEVARLRLSMGTDLDVGVLDRGADGVLMWSTPPDASAVDGLRAVTRKVRDVVGPDARPTVWFDRGGWSPKLFAELRAAGFEVLTCGKGFADAVPRHAFQGQRFIDRGGHAHDYLLAESDVDIEYDGGRRRFKCRRITILEPRGGHQTQIVTSRSDLDAATIAHAAFHRWGQQDFVEFMRGHNGGAALDPDVGADTARGLPASDVGRDAASLASECVRLRDAVRMATYNAGSALASLLDLDQAGDPTRGLLGETYRTPGDVRIVDDELRVCLEPLSAPLRTRAVASLCADLTATETPYPGTDLRLVYSMASGGDYGARW